jgi:hypothetical protein
MGRLATGCRRGADLGIAPEVPDEDDLVDHREAPSLAGCTGPCLVRIPR